MGSDAKTSQKSAAGKSRRGPRPIPVKKEESIFSSVSKDAGNVSNNNISNNNNNNEDVSPGRSKPEKTQQADNPPGGEPGHPGHPGQRTRAEELPTLMKERQKERPNDRAKYIVDTSEKPQDKGEVNELIYKEQMAAKERIKRLENNPMTVEALENFSAIEGRLLQSEGLEPA